MGSFLSCYLAASMCVAGLAVDVSGKWNGNLEIKLPDGSVVTQLAWAEFDQKGQAITGSAGGGDSDESSPIEKVVFDGKNLAFQFTGPDGRVYKANLALADEAHLEGTLDFELPDGTALAARMALKRGEKR
jgi:hypothetical protein